MAQTYVGKRVLGFDPGGTTGWCVLERGADGGVVVVGRGQLIQKWDAGAIGFYRDVQRHVEQMFVVVDESKPHTVVMEDFVLRPGGGGGRAGTVSMCIINQFYALWYEREYGALYELAFQGASAKVSIKAKNEYLKKHGAYFKGLPHATDAARHAMLKL